MSQSEMITNQFGEQYLYAVNRGMFEQESAHDRIEREFGELLAREESLIIFIGSDSGNIIRYVIEQGVPAGTRYIFIEPKDILHKIAESIDISEFLEQIYLITPDQFMEVAKSVSINDYLYIEGVRFNRSLSAEYGYIAEYRSDYWKIDGVIQDYRWNAFMAVGLSPFIRRQLRNCADNLHPLSEIKGCLKGKTVIVLGGGPSLDDHLDWIKEHRKKLVVFAVSRISTRLQQVDLEPDFVFSVDPQDSNYPVSRAMLNFSSNVIFVNQYHMESRIIAEWPHKKFFMGDLFPWESTLNPKNNCMGSGPTVTNAAIHAAIWLGSKDILLAGVDLCFTPEGFTHAQGSNERAAGPKTDLPDLSVITNSGCFANTLAAYASAARNIAWQATLLRKDGGKITNLSLHAAKMDNVEYKEIDKVHLDSSTINLDIPSYEAYREEGKLLKIKKELENKKNSVKAIQEIILKASEIHKVMYSDETVDQNLKNELDDLDKCMSEEYPQILRLIKTLSIRVLLHMAQSFKSSDEWELKYARDKLNIYYYALALGSDNLMNQIEDGLESVRIRLGERHIDKMNATEVDTLIADWEKRAETGRAKFYTATTANDGALAKIRQAYEEEMQSDPLRELTRKNKSENLHSLPARVQFLKDQNDVDTLEALYSAWVGDSEAAPYLPLISATLYKMKGQAEDALQSLLVVMEQPDSPVLEQSLAMMVGLCTELGFHQAVLDAMAGLASLNAYYLSIYADALYVNGQVNDAIEHLVAYLHYFPADRLAVKKLGGWYSESGSSEGVSLANTWLEKLQ